MEVEGGMEMSERFSLMHTNKTKEMSIDFWRSQPSTDTGLFIQTAAN